jgi:UDP-N-acetylmuramyl pentapeptide synthase
VCESLTIGVSIKKIKEGLNNFKGVKGRTSINEQNGIRIIEEINPGLNVTAIKKAISMLENMDNVGVIFGGKYGVTCEEIDEESVSDVLERINEDKPLILVDKLGASVKNILKRNSIYFNDLDDAMENVVDKNIKNVLVIYRSNFSDLKNR